jgi:hypothetical protein
VRVGSHARARALARVDESPLVPLHFATAAAAFPLEGESRQYGRAGVLLRIRRE